MNVDFYAVENSMLQGRPLIGITSNDRVQPGRAPLYQAKVAYARAVSLAGGLPVFLPYAEKETAISHLGRLDGIILSGGADVPADVQGVAQHPACFYMSRERWESEKRWYETALETETPVLGICLGMQVMCVCSGGRLLQDVPGHRSKAIEGADPVDVVHPVLIEAGSWLATRAAVPMPLVVSCHHQAAEELPPGFTLAATAPDGTIEAIERGGSGFAVGVQWHPERDGLQPDWVINGFVECCARKMKGAC